MDRPLTQQDFAPYAGQRFTCEGHPLALLLRSVEPQPLSAAPNTAREPFTLVFTGPASDILPQGHHRITAPDGAAFELHIAPIHTPIRDRQDYQAVFN